MNEAERKALTEAGLPASYIPRKLRDLDGAEPVYEWIRQQETLAQVREGRGALVHAANGTLSMDCCYLMARALMIGGLETRCVDLQYILDNGYEQLWDLTHQTKVLVLPRFHESEQGDQSPFTAAQRWMVEDFLHSWLSDQRALILGVTGTNTGQWWSNRLLARVTDTGKVFNF